MPNSVYCIKDNRLIISDNELDISIDTEFLISKTKNPKSLNEKEVLEVKEYYPSKMLKAHRYYLLDKLHGPSIYFYENGLVATKIWYVNGKRQGKSFQYYKSSRIYSLQRFKDDMKQGFQKYFYEDGVLKSEFFYTNNLIDKKMVLFWENGKNKREVNFFKGKRHGFDKIFSEDQKLLFIGEYENNKPVGHHKNYDNNEILREEIIYKNNSYEKKTYDHLGDLIINE
jgi:antitoxin component YwqK of YwqJK toxin-antitoxin module